MHKSPDLKYYGACMQISPAQNALTFISLSFVSGLVDNKRFSQSTTTNLQTLSKILVRLSTRQATRDAISPPRSTFMWRNHVERFECECLSTSSSTARINTLATFPLARLFYRSHLGRSFRDQPTAMVLPLPEVQGEKRLR